MNAEQITTIVTNVLTSGGVITFLWFLLRGLQNQIKSLNKTIEAQNKTLEVMEKRIVETERIGDIYRNLIRDLPDDIERFKSITRLTKDEIIMELEKANQLKDEKLKSMTEIELRKLEIQEQIVTDLPRLRDELIETSKAIQQRINTMKFFLIADFRQRDFWDRGDHKELRDWTSSYLRWFAPKIRKDHDEYFQLLDRHEQQESDQHEDETPITSPEKPEDA